jgi:hypothetical protein
MNRGLEPTIPKSQLQVGTLVLRQWRIPALGKVIPALGIIGVRAVE